ncbi:olfactory receptor 2A12-like [Peromyscus californicus insignis]|uniref:olfactory receptor 2A12-like n=1 Tax=Peromyscus californicus insignis TaxID=564181 RepID=UPI0022A78FD0|nr:olfactory receptor 2A12-like [Peromyscus californicus insignis]
MWGPLMSSRSNRDGSVAAMGPQNFSTITELVLVGFSDHPQTEIPLFLFFSLVYLANCLGNTAVIMLVALDSSLQTPMYFFLCHLAFLNGFFSTVVTPKMLFNFLASRKVISYPFCLAQTYLTLFLESTECFLLAVMAIDRYVAICYPLRYLLIMSWVVCIALAVAVWVTGFCASVIPLYVVILPLCGPYIVDYLFCELPILLHMFCADTSLQEAIMAIGGAGTVLFPFLLIVLSYLRILVAVIRIDSVEGRKKAFSTCASHLAVVTIYYGTGLIRYLRPKSLYSAEGDKLISVFYAVIGPALNPFIYSLRNKEVQSAMRRVIERYKKGTRITF